MTPAPRPEYVDTNGPQRKFDPIRPTEAEAAAANAVTISMALLRPANPGLRKIAQTMIAVITKTAAIELTIH